MNTASLKKLGLSDTEIKCYLCLIESERSTIVTIADKIGTNRTALYDILENLINKGLATYVYEGKKKYFMSTDPTNLINHFEEKKEAIEKLAPELNMLIGDLKKVSPKKMEYLNVEIYRGVKGIKVILEDVFKVCKKGDEVLAFGFGGSNYLKILGPYYHHWIKRRSSQKAGIKFRGIFNESEKDEPYVKALGKVPMTQAKFIFQNYETPTRTKIYGNKVAIIIMEKYPTAILIKDEKIAEGYRYFFEFLWRTSQENKN